MKLIIDEREASIFDKCPSTEKIQVTKQVLPLGDMIIRSNEDRDILIIERKSLQDLLASIKDGRYEEQSYRLRYSAGIPMHNIIYVIEGVFAQLHNPADKRTIFSAMTSLNVFKGFSVIRTSCLQETAEWLMALADKVERDMTVKKLAPHYKISASVINDESVTQEEEPVAESQPTNYCSVVKKVKKDNVTMENMGEIILCQIPGVSSVSAVAIMKHFRSISHLIDSLKTDANCLDAITCDNSGKARKMSKPMVKNIRDYLLY
jgi:crossover junction endonuclease MUS81